MKISLKTVAAACVFAAMCVGWHMSSSIHSTNDLLVSNIEALTHGEAPQTSNTGPGKTYDCPGWGTGDGKMCMCSNTNPCTEIPC